MRTDHIMTYYIIIINAVYYNISEENSLRGSIIIIIDIDIKSIKKIIKPYFCNFYIFVLSTISADALYWVSESHTSYIVGTCARYIWIKAQKLSITIYALLYYVLSR